MEIKQLRHFLVTAKHRKIQRAAGELNMSQSALTRSLRALESSLGVPLFERDSRGVRLTVYGESLVTHAGVILNEAQKTINEIGALSGGTTETAALGTTPNYTANIVATGLARLIKDRPNIKVSIEEGNLKELMPRLRLGELDLLLMLVPAALREPGIIFEVLGTEELIIVARSDHPLTKVKKLALGDLAGSHWIVSDPLSSGSNSIHDYFAASRSSGMVYVRSISLRLKTVMSSDLLTIVPARSCLPEMRAKAVARLNVSDFEVTAVAGLIYPERARKPPAVREISRRLRAVYAESSTRQI